MRTRLLLKQVDFYIQVLAYLIPAILSIWHKDVEYLFAGYVSVGSMQLLSCIINRFTWDSFLRDNGRIYYEWMLAIIAGWALLCMLGWSVIHGYTASFAGQLDDTLSGLLLIILMFCSPFMALWYSRMTYVEMNMVKMHIDRKQYV